MRVVQRVVLPSRGDVDVHPLYLEADTGQGVGMIRGRRSVALQPHKRVSFCTYFNAFPASYWHRHSVVEEVILRLQVRGEATVRVYRSTGKGFCLPVDVIDVDRQGGTAEVVLPLAPFVDGGWYWFDLIAGPGEAVLESAEWCVDTDRPQGTVTIGITTFNRTEFCVRQLRTLAAALDVLAIVDEILVVDQGAEKVADHPDLLTASRALGAQLRIIEQVNLGGSGGFSRAMAEALDRGRSDHLLLLDDDAVIEPEGVLRVVAFADLARADAIVGGHMLDIYHRTVLHVLGETVLPHGWWMVPAPHTFYRHDFAAGALRDTAWLHRRADVDFSPWWMCLIPMSVVRGVGLSLPVFIKWDDIEYGLRAGEHGFPSVTLPGAAVWHMPWHSKDDAIGWQAYFRARNRFITALMYSPHPRGGGLLKESLLLNVRHALSMQYSTAELELRGIEDVLAGPEALHSSMAAKPAELSALRRRFVDAHPMPRIDDFPPVRSGRPRRGVRQLPTPSARRATAPEVLAAIPRQLRPPAPAAGRHPEALVPHADRHWSLLARLDSALVCAAEGDSVAWHRRNPRQFWSLLRRTAALHLRLLLRWPRLSATYKLSAPGLVSPERWRETFAAPWPAGAPVAGRVGVDGLGGRERDLTEGQADDRSPVEIR